MYDIKKTVVDDKVVFLIPSELYFQYAYSEQYNKSKLNNHSKYIKMKIKRWNLTENLDYFKEDNKIYFNSEIFFKFDKVFFKQMVETKMFEYITDEDDNEFIKLQEKYNDMTKQDDKQQEQIQIDLSQDLSPEYYQEFYLDKRTIGDLWKLICYLDIKQIIIRR